MPAFARAVELGYRYVETDVHLTADGVVVAFHDESLDRVSHRAGRIADLSWHDVAAADVGGASVPRLDELLSTWPDLRVNIDPKTDAVVEALAEVITRAAAVDRVCVGSFSDRRLARIRGLLGPRLATSLGPRATARLKAASRRVPVGRFDAACVQVPVRTERMVLVDRRFVEAAHRRGLQVHVWTIDEPGEMHRLLDLGVDGLMTDRPAVLKEVLTARGSWG